MEKLAHSLRKACGECNSITPVTCITDCRTWKLKNQLRRLYEKTRSQNYMMELLNALKNERRIQILKSLTGETASSARLQKRLAELGYHHGQQTILEEYLNPLVKVGLVEEDQNHFHATVFGRRIDRLVTALPEMANMFPPHSECHEETTLVTLESVSKTYADLRKMIMPKSLTRALKRLQTEGLAEKSNEKDHVFFFRTRRNPGTSYLSPTEKRTYENIAAEGIAARKLAQKAGISLRRTYEYLRKLKGKKLVFIRKKPVTYGLTAKGVQVARLLAKIREAVTEAVAATALILRDKDETELRSLGTAEHKRSKKQKEATSFTAIDFTERSQVAPGH